MRQHAAQVARKHIILMLRTQVRDPSIAKVEDEVFFWRDGNGSIGPAVIVEVDTHGAKLFHNGQVKT